MWSLGYIQILESSPTVTTSCTSQSEKNLIRSVAELSVNAHFFENDRLGCDADFESSSPSASNSKPNFTSPSRDGQASESSDCTPKLDRTTSEVDDDFVFVESNQVKENNQRSVLQSGMFIIMI